MSDTETNSQLSEFTDKLGQAFDKIIEKFDLDRDKYTNPIQYLENTDNQENFTMLRKEIKQIRKTLWIYQLKKKKKPLMNMPSYLECHCLLYLNKH